MMHPMTAMKKVREERGQAIILFVGLFTVIMVIGVISVDFGLWVSERRGAQKDADAASLAGVQAYLADPSDTDTAFDDAVRWAENNGVDQAKIDGSPTSNCSPGNSCINADVGNCHEDGSDSAMPWVEAKIRHDSRALFGSIFGLAAPDIGAVARACVGSLTGMTGLRPWAVPMSTSVCFQGGEPQYGQDCIFRLESPSSQVGSIRLGDDPGDDCNEPGGGAAKYRENVTEGADAFCSIGEIINTEPGLNTGPTFDALHTLLSGESECDDLDESNHDGVDQFSESFSPSSDSLSPDVTFVALDCETPRAINIVIVEEFDAQGQDSMPILGFAAFFLEQCEEVDSDGNVVNVFEKCDVPSGARSRTQIRGFFMSILATEGEVGDLDPFGTKAIGLVK